MQTNSSGILETDAEVSTEHCFIVYQNKSLSLEKLDYGLSISSFELLDQIPKLLIRTAS